MPAVIHGIKDGVDQALETVSAVIRHLESLEEPSLEHDQCLNELKATVQPGLTRAREKAAAAQRRKGSRVVRG